MEHCGPKGIPDRDAHQVGEREPRSQIWDLIPVTHRMHALEREIVSIVRALTSTSCPFEEGATETFLHFLSLLIEDLLKFPPRIASL